MPRTDKLGVLLAAAFLTIATVFTHIVFYWFPDELPPPSSIVFANPIYRDTIGALSQQYVAVAINASAVISAAAVCLVITVALVVKGMDVKKAAGGFICTTIVYGLLTISRVIIATPWQW